MPPALQDVALIVDEKIGAASVESALRKGAGELLESIVLFDRYDKMGDGKVSLAYSLTFRAPDRTLTGAEITQAREAAVAQAVKDCGAVLRTA
jgi:phenylalanyl-tRNA synthetase beta chain